MDFSKLSSSFTLPSGFLGALAMSASVTPRSTGDPLAGGGDPVAGDGIVGQQRYNSLAQAAFAALPQPPHRRALDGRRTSAQAWAQLHFTDLGRSCYWLQLLTALQPFYEGGSGTLENAVERRLMPLALRYEG